MHGMCGAFGTIVVGIFCAPRNYLNAYAIYPGAETKCAGLWYGGHGAQLGAQITFVLFIVAWVGGLATFVFAGLKALKILRVAEEVEDEGLDASEHGVDKTKQHVLVAAA
jgi:Amt family ammonium transporter